MALITITNKTGSGGYEIAKRVANGLSVTLFDDQMNEIDFGGRGGI